METEKIELKENCSMNKVSFHNNDIENSCSTPKKKKHAEKEEPQKEEFLTCSKCSYTCKKGNTLKKHMLTKHKGHQCKECNKKLSTLVDLLKHVSTCHYQEQNDVQEEQTENGEVKLSKIEEQEVSSSVFDESQIYCELCSIKCKNKKSLEKHMNSNHEGHKSCEVCGKNLLKKHAKNIHNESSFVFSESMLDEFL